MLVILSRASEGTTFVGVLAILLAFFHGGRWLNCLVSSETKARR